ncbi:unnamed protein product [Brachionus calyciflorus]|uniref:Apple domain-containing protein n=1 Tax=Brachionus calyciflorus TaxID=104777 RepID=A0A813M2R9_9BILA|nr:unnamed protein product [Brachionus calyciflorus]
MIKLNSILILLVVVQYLKAQNPIKYCQPFTQNIDPSDYPKLPDEFQTRIEMNFLSQSRNSEAFILYDRYDKRADYTIREQSNVFRQIYDFEHNELFTIIDKNCTAQRINETKGNYFFGLVQDQSGLNMKPPNFLFHFNNGFPHEKKEQKTWRGIPVNHFVSCQDWPELNANVQVDYYFTVPDYKPAVSYFEEVFKELPVAVKVKGYSDINVTAQTKRDVNHEYSFFEFRPIVERKSELFNLPRGMYCEGQKYKEPIPKIPESFSYTSETIIKELNFASNSRVFYSNKLKTYRIDLPFGLGLEEYAVKDPVKLIHDYNSGVAYVINKIKGNCTFYPIGAIKIDNNDEVHLDNGYFTLKPPTEFFRIDDSFVYAGERYERGILCDVFVSKKSDFNFTGIDAESFVLELYFLKIQLYVDQSTDQKEYVAPISAHITAVGKNFTLITHFYDFDSKSSIENFDVSECFQGKSRINFGIRFNYPQGVDEETFSQFYGRYLVDDFENKIMKSFKFFSASPLRIARPRFETHRRGFIVYSAITDYADAINHFNKNGKAKVDFMKIKHGAQGYSAETCAQICISDAQYTVPLDYKCFSFDVCVQPSGGVFCSFYNYTLTTDPAVVSDDKPECDHYAKTTENFDSANTSALFRMIEEAVVRDELNLEVKDVEGNTVLTFPASDIFQPTQTSGQTNQGQTSFFKQFILASPTIDFNETEILKNDKLMLRTNTGASLDECARFCVQEPAFECQIFTYDKILQNCKWSSIRSLIDNENPTDSYFIEKEGCDVFLKDPLYNYIKFPSKVTSIVDYTIADVQSESQCATKCNNEKKFKCRSFNFCDSDDGKAHRCLLSQTNIHNLDKDPFVVTTSLCSHFSKRALNDFKFVAHTQLKAKPETQLTNTSVESCAEICVLDDSFFCRSFDYFIDTRTCLLYKENIIDKFSKDLGITTNLNVNHYSREYYEKDGVLKKIEPLKEESIGNFGAGTFVGILATILIGGLILGILIGFVYLKLSKKDDMLPVMKFINPNYKRQVDE